jgi:hypothetical protein
LLLPGSAQIDQFEKKHDSRHGYRDLIFDTTDLDSINDAFEVSFVTANGRSEVFTIPPIPNRDSYYNVTEGMPSLPGDRTSEDVMPDGQEVVTVDITHLFGGQQATFIVRLVNNDDDTLTQVKLPVRPDLLPDVTIKLTNDTAPTGPGSEPYRTDQLTNDPRVHGTAADDFGITRLEIMVDGGDFIDITDDLQGTVWAWDPGNLTPGEHMIKVRAMDTRDQTNTATLTFRVNERPRPDAGGDRITNEGQTLAFDGSSTTDLEGIYAYHWKMPDASTADTLTTNFLCKQDGVYPVILTVTDTAGSIATDEIDVTVNNLAPVISHIDDQEGDEGDLFAFMTDFTDAGILDTHTGVINWGDGTPDDDAVIIEQHGSGTVSGSHWYLDDGKYTVTVTVTDDAQASHSVQFTVEVHDVVPQVEISGPERLYEASTYVLNMSVTDPGLDTVTKWKINWGDGHEDILNGNPTTATHLYTDGDELFYIRAWATNEDGEFESNTMKIIVDNVVPTLVIDGPGFVDEGSLYTLSLSSTDPGLDTITHWTINWGDDDIETVNGDPAFATHIYADGPHTYTISATATDEDGTWDANSVVVNVLNVAPSLIMTSFFVADEGDLLEFAASFLDPGIIDTHTAVINWGDGSPEEEGTIILVNGIKTVTGNHVYADNGSYTISLTVTDKDGGTGSGTSKASIFNVAPTATPSSNRTAERHVPFTVQAATFTDPGFTFTKANTVETFTTTNINTTTTINWGDGTPTENANTVWTPGSAGTPTTGSVTGTHTYTATGTYMVTITVRDDYGGEDTETFQVVVNLPGVKFYVVNRSAVIVSLPPSPTSTACNLAMIIPKASPIRRPVLPA